MMESPSKIKGKIVLVPFPFDDFSTTKVRPAVCLTDRIGIHQHVVLAFITSKIPNEILDSDIVIDLDELYSEVTGLRVSSTLRLHRLMTVSSFIIKRELGVLSTDLLKIVDQKLMNLFEL